MVWEDPHSHALSLLRAAPRSWLAESEAVSIVNAPTTHGRVSFNASATEAGVTVHAKLVPHAAACIHSKVACSAPMTIQLRRPEAAGKISAVSIDGKRCTACWNDELVTLGAVSATGVTAEVMYSKGDVRIKTDDGAAPKPHVVIAIGGKLPLLSLELTHLLGAFEYNRSSADDYGWNNIGYHGNKEVHTPTLDRLARGGLILDRHYVFK